MRSITVCAILVLVALGCAEPEEESLIQASDFATEPPQVSDVAGQYYYATLNSTCESFFIDSAGVAYTEFFSGICGSGSKVECGEEVVGDRVRAFCSLACLEFNRSDTTAIFSIVDMRPYTEELAFAPIGKLGEHLSLGPYRPRGLSDMEWPGIALEPAVRFNLISSLVDCEQSIKTKADSGE